ncbi:MAG: CRISPR-associated endonuclease Cas2, partial [Anaerococcus vaginalis]
VFRGEISPSKIIALKREIEKTIKKEEDFVTIIKMYNKEFFEEETIGKYKSLEEDLIL